MNPLIPMFVIAGRPSALQLQNMMQKYLDHGIKSVMIYPRTGCEIEYMSNEWHDACLACIEFADKNNMDVWLYDEFNYPSGSCQNQVLKESDSYIAKRFEIIDGKISIKKLYVDKTNLKEQPFSVDVLNPEAVKCFIALTHDRYFEWFGKYFTKVIKGIFTDEPSFTYSARKTGQYPYYDGICDDYKNLYGSDLQNDLLEFEINSIKNEFPLRFWSIIGNRFKKTFMGQISDWCNKHNIMLTGHFFIDDNVNGTVKATGKIFENLKMLHVPGVDDIFTNISSTEDFLFSQIQTLRRQGFKYAMAELFALGPCSMSYARKKQILWYAASYGVNKFFLAISHLDARGNLIKDKWFNNFSYADPAFGGIVELGKSAKCAAEYADKTPLSGISLRYPYSSTIKAMGEKSDVWKYDNLLTKCIDQLNLKQLPWKLIEEEETSDTTITLAFKNNGIYEENTNMFFENPGECIKKIELLVKRSITVTEESGELAKNILVKSYADGSYLIIDRSNKPNPKRKLVLNNNGKKKTFTLYSFGVFTDKTETNIVTGEKLDIKNPLIRFPENNVLRCIFDKNNRFHFYAEENVLVTINSRIYPKKGMTFLDGDPLNLSENSTGLTDCFNGLYAKASPINLSAGKHVITTDTKDISFLPSVIIEGNFDLNRYTISPIKKTYNASKDYCFYKKAHLTFDCTLPSNISDAYITFEDNLMYTALVINREPISEKAFAPYNFRIPEKYYGKDVKCELIFHSSFAPLFGDIASTNVDDRLWRPSNPENIHISGLNVCYKKKC